MRLVPIENDQCACRKQPVVDAGCGANNHAKDQKRVGEMEHQIRRCGSVPKAGERTG